MRPFILEYAEEQKELPDYVYSYDETLSLNVIESASGKIPLIESNIADVKLDTLTEVGGEDVDISKHIFSLDTETRVFNEATDVSFGSSSFLTKTMVSQEQDDK